jgi:hypothetical protein
VLGSTQPFHEDIGGVVGGLDIFEEQALVFNVVDTNVVTYVYMLGLRMEDAEVDKFQGALVVHGHR